MVNPLFYFHLFFICSASGVCCQDIPVRPTRAIAVALIAIASLAPARADPAAHGWREVWGGADASAHVWLIYSGMTVAPHSDIFSDGLRLRIAGRLRRLYLRWATAQRTGVVHGRNRLWRSPGRLPEASRSADRQGLRRRRRHRARRTAVRPGKSRARARGWAKVGGRVLAQYRQFRAGPPSTSRGPARIRPPPPACAAAIASSGMSPSAWKAASTPTILARMRAPACSRAMPGMAERCPSLAAFPGRFLEEAQSLEDPYATANLLTQF